jgi:3-methyladenine DNA glycosylase/8-oxoguanine DNA glycosylase
VPALPLPQPFAAEPLLAFLAARAIPGVESVTATAYERPGLRLRLRSGRVDVLEGDPAAARRLLDLDAPIADIAARLGADAPIAGLRVPGCVDGFELAVRAVLGQQVSVAAASTLAGRIVEHHGGHFPSAPELAAAEPLTFMPPTRARALRHLARAVADGLRLDPPLDLARTRADLLALPGIGPWTVEYVAMRALGDRDAYPAGDLVLRRADGGRADQWRPYRAYAAMQLWAAASGSSSPAPGSATTAAPAADSTTPASRTRSQTARSQTASSSDSSATTTGTVAG